ncbi:cell wall-binding repeat-containing protein [Catenulispora subtropica]|uniref:WD40 domain protein beta Propeller n=1 Tax=Catenulispora subtropica TaxID=450798 RepID=A0ABN2QTX9_9ACTN
MRSSHLRKSLAASALFATSVASAAGLASSAQATPPGAANSPLTVTNGTQSVAQNGHAVQYAGNIAEGAWAPDGSRIAYVRADGAVVTERAGGGGLVVVAPAKAGVTRSHPAWFVTGAAIVFSETVNGHSKIMSVPAFTAPDSAVQETSPLSFLASTMPEGTETAVESNGKSLVFQHHDAGTNHEQIWVQDSYGRGSGGPVAATSDAADSTDPTISPDGKTIVFVRGDGSGNKQLWAVPWDSANYQHPAGTPVQLTHDAHDHLHPAWSPDGTRIAYENGPGHGAAPTDVQSVAKDGSGPRQEWNQPGVPAYQPQNTDSVTRLAGDDRIGTAIAASKAQWVAAPGNPDAGKSPANAVVLSRSDQFADALGGSTLATVKDGPLLLTPTDHLDAGVKAEIQRVLGPAKADKTVYVLGGEQALSPAVYNAVKSMGYTVKRLAGADRYSTSIAIATEVTDGYGGQNSWSQPDRVLVATGNNAPDALSAGAAAEAFNDNGPATGVVILTNDKTMPAATAAYLAQVKAHGDAKYPTPVYGVGGQADTALKSIGYQHTGLVGNDRYQTSYLVAKTFFDGWGLGHVTPRAVGFATGVTWPDALSGGAFMGHEHGPLLLVNPVGGEPSKDAEQWLTGWSPTIASAFIFGGTKAVPEVTGWGVASLIAGPAGTTSSLNPKA